MAKKEKPKFSDLTGVMENPSTPVQGVAPVEVIQKAQQSKALDDLSKEPAVNFTTSLPLSLREKLKEKAIREKTSAKDLIIEALLYRFEDLR
ncbi:hypothetical protein HX049_17890 [Myroides odoratimimus]|uniref:hypothetical protein n=1 Tax=Myroides odoratimimus TaxID=76832 RepID=UPI0025759F64|nr:hypothetical protein [Myroides odoratimimus]MDM1399008.1 hypothetical protein [Myroides odoratimimus]